MAVRDSDTRARSNNPGCLQASDVSLTFGLTNSTKRARRSPRRHTPNFIPHGCPPPGGASKSDQEVFVVGESQSVESVCKKVPSCNAPERVRTRTSVRVPGLDSECVQAHDFLRWWPHRVSGQTARSLSLRNIHSAR